MNFALRKAFNLFSGFYEQSITFGPTFGVDKTNNRYMDKGPDS